MNSQRSSQNPFLYSAVFFTAGAGIGYQITLLRAFSYTGYYHFSFLIISLALLGFGISGTAINIFQGIIKRNAEAFIRVLFCLFIITLPLCYLIIQHLPFDIQYLFYSAKQLFYLLLILLLLTLPFFSGAALLGIFLFLYPDRVKQIYGFNLLGSGAGGLGAIILLEYILPEKAPLFTALAPCAAFFAWYTFYGTISGRYKGLLLPAVLTLMLLPLLFLIPVNIHVDRYKTAAFMEILSAQGDAKKILTRSDAVSRLDIYASPANHSTLFASLTNTETTPPQLTLLHDGQAGAPLFLIKKIQEAGIMRYTPQSLVYRLTKQPSVLLLEDTGGTASWLAALFGAKEITNVVGDKKTAGILTRGIPGYYSGSSVYPVRTQLVNRYPRLFLETTESIYNIIHISSTESLVAGAGGLSSLQEDYVLTVEGIARGIGLLREKGFLSVTRGLQSPPRDNLKILALFKKALEASGRKNPGEHIFQARNYLAVTTILSASPFTAEEISLLKQACEELIMDTEYYPGIDSASLKQINKIPGPEGSEYSYYHQGAMKILFGNEKLFFKKWLFRLSPPTDNSPYFSNFFKSGLINRFNEIYGPYWFRKVELGFPVLLVTFSMVVLIAFLMILLPLFFRKKRKYSLPVSRALYFIFIGIAFMFFEITFIQKLIKYLGNPVYSTTLVISSMLFFAGAGSMSQELFSKDPVARLHIGSLAIPLLTVICLLLMEPVMGAVLKADALIRSLTAVLLLAPLFYTCGLFLSSGVEVVKKEGASIPLAWGINGFASVAATPLGLILSMRLGFRPVLFLAAFFYLACGWLISVQRKDTSSLPWSGE